MEWITDFFKNRIWAQLMLGSIFTAWFDTIFKSVRLSIFGIAIDPVYAFFTLVLLNTLIGEYFRDRKKKNRHHSDNDTDVSC